MMALAAGTVTASEYSDLVTSHGPVAYWRLGESSGTTAADATGSHDGTYQNSVTLSAGGAISGDSNTAATFGGGANDRVQVNAFGISGSGITILAWFKPSGFGNDRFLAKATGTAVSEHYWALGLDSSSRLSAFLKISGTTQNRTPTVSGMANGVWSFAALTYDGATMVTYFNGQQVDSAAFAGTLSTDSSVAVALGNLPSGAGNRAFSGALDEVAVFDKPLTAAEIYDLYIAGGAGLLGHWKLVETSGTNADDSSPQANDGTYNNGVVLGSAGPYPGVGDKAANFDGSDDFVAIANENLYDLTGPMSVAAWFKVDVFDDNEQAIVTKGNNAWRLQRAGSTNAVEFYCNSLSTQSVVSSVDVNDGKWHHAVGIYTGSQLQIYIDGELSNSVNSSGSIQTNNRAVRIARNSQGSARYFDGLIHNVRIYSRDLSATEVAKLYGSVGHWKLNQTSGTTATDSSLAASHGTVNGAANWSTRCTGTGVFDFDGSSNYVSIPSASHLQPTSAMTIAGWVKGDSWGSGSDVDVILRKGEGDPNNYQLAIADGKIALYLDDSDAVGIRGNTVLTAGQWYHVAATWDGSTVKIFVNGQLDNSAARTGTIATDTRPVYLGGHSGADYFDGMIYDVRFYNRAIYPADVAELAGLVGHWKLDEASGLTAADSSPAGNNGTLIGGTWTSGRIDGGLQLNGTSNYVNVPHAPSLSLTSQITVAAWVNAGALNDWQTVIQKGTSGGIGNYYFGTYYDEVDFSLYDGGWFDFITTGVNLQTGTWYHLAATFDNATDEVHLYVDGVEVLSTTTTASPQANSQNLTVGTYETSLYWNGTLDDVRIYGRVLCPSEIQDLYNGGNSFEGVKIIKWVEIQ
ncbi:MAG: LamG domain-containing protein [Planctomycetes bacterium]|nr:LamG domain-containing protein [Planctomycetota bacterium]